MIAERIDYAPRSYNKHCVIVPVTKEADEAAWLAERRHSVGSSGAAAALGLSPYSTTYAHWLEDVGLLEPEDISQKPAVKAGVKLESLVAEWYAEETGSRIERVNGILRSKEHPFIHATLDRRIVGAESFLECKTAGFWAGKSEEWGNSEDRESDAVPMQYRIQVEVGMIVTGWQTSRLAVLIGGQDLRWFTCDRDPELDDMIVNGLDSYWNKVMQAREIIADARARGIADPEKLIPKSLIPAPTDSSDLKLRYPRSIPKPIEATPEIVALFDELLDARQAKAHADADVEERKVAICDFMGERDELTYNGDTLATWRMSKPRATFAADRHAKEQAACHELYAGVASAARPFNIKEPK